jgi:hypothetical protein
LQVAHVPAAVAGEEGDSHPRLIPVQAPKND